MCEAPPQPIGQSPPPDFDRVARLYRWAEFVCLGPLLRRTRESFLEEAASARQALVIGDGDGRFLAALLARSPHLRAQALDTSASMLRILARRCGFAQHRLTCLRMDVRCLPPDMPSAATDLVVTHFVLDCLTDQEVAQCASQLTDHLAPGTRWILSDFGIPPHRPWKTLGRAYVRALYWIFGRLTGLRQATLPNIQGALQSAGFQRIARRERLRGLLYSEIWQLT